MAAHHLYISFISYTATPGGPPPGTRARGVLMKQTDIQFVKVKTLIHLFIHSLHTRTHTRTFHYIDALVYVCKKSQFVKEKLSFITHIPLQ